MERDVTRVGLVGVGTIARTHLEVLAERSDVDLLFTADPHAGPPSFRGTTPAHLTRLHVSAGRFSFDGPAPM
ncbi:hypothetical protein [Saccharothrix carnea]|uniref:hypothetical protein n=1 Tax=Saccharothrix carnea TaxID=1280637 RepID=UPI000D0D90CA|nr:hypothetical protein [Saccharothrix carnea]